MIKDMEEAVELLRELIEVQKGEISGDEYMRGMANGLICALAVIEESDPEYVEAPDPVLYKVEPHFFSVDNPPDIDRKVALLGGVDAQGDVVACQVDQDGRLLCRCPECDKEFKK